MIDNERKYIIHINEKDGTIYAIENGKLVYNVGNLFQPIPEWINKRDIIKKVGNIDFNSNKKSWWEAIIEFYGPESFDSNPFPINNKKENQNNMNTQNTLNIRVGDRVKISRKMIKTDKCYHPNWENLIAKIINKSPNKMPYVLDINGDKVSIGEGELSWIIGTVEIPMNSIIDVEHAFDVKERKKKVLKYISSLLHEYHIPHSKNMILEINQYLEDFMMDMDNSTNGEPKRLPDYKLSLADKVLDNPELREEMKKFVLKLMDEAEQEKLKLSQLNDTESQNDLNSLSTMADNQL